MHSRQILKEIMSMRVKHPDFSTACLQALCLPTPNTDVERGCSAYNEIVCHRRCRLLQGNVELMLCLFFNDSLNTEQKVTGFDDQKFTEL